MTFFNDIMNGLDNYIMQPLKFFFWHMTIYTYYLWLQASFTLLGFFPESSWTSFVVPRALTELTGRQQERLATRLTMHRLTGLCETSLATSEDFRDYLDFLEHRVVHLECRVLPDLDALTTEPYSDVLGMDSSALDEHGNVYHKQGLAYLEQLYFSQKQRSPLEEWSLDHKSTFLLESPLRQKYK